MTQLAAPPSSLRRRRIVTAVTLVVGTTLLGLSLAVEPGAVAFYPLTSAVAVVWIVGGLGSGPIPLGSELHRGGRARPILVAIGIGLIASAVFVVGALVVREIGPLHDFVQSALDHARKGSFAGVAVITVVNGAAEEVFFRGALFDAVGRRHRVLISTAIYTLATVATGNPMLVFAAATLGIVWALQRRETGGILASMLTHVTWSVVMLFALPALFPT
jgi:membrane protease YdiL (CAAX protease family)